MKKQAILTALYLLTILVSVSTVSAADTYVNGSVIVSGDGSSWDQAVKTIQEGYNGVTEGNTINIAAGTYTGAGNKNIDIIMNVNIQGAGQDQTIIDCEDDGRAFVISFCSTESSVNIKDLTIKNGNADNGGAIFGFSNLVVEKCTFTNNHATDSGGAIYHPVDEYDILTITGCNFFKNSANIQGGTIYSPFVEISNLAYIIIKYSRFVGNTVVNSPQDIYMDGGTLNAQLNWWGNNNGPETGRVTGSEGNVPGPETCTPWLVININANPPIIYTEQTSTITADVYQDSSGGDHAADASQFFSGSQVIFTTDLGNIGSKSVTTSWAFGKAVATLLADEGVGVATVTAADVQIVPTTVTILQSLVTPTNPQTPLDPVTTTENGVNAATSTSRTVEMHETGTPIAGLILTVLMFVGGLVTSKK